MMTLLLNIPFFIQTNLANANSEKSASVTIPYHSNNSQITNINIAENQSKNQAKTLNIATFDSGFGGYFTAHAIAQKAKQLQQQKQLSQEVTIHHFGDTANAPYGEKTPTQIAQFTSKGVIDAFKNGADYVFIACNTASTQYEKVQQEVENAFPKQEKSKKVFSIIDVSVAQLKKHIDDGFKNKNNNVKTDNINNINILILSTPATMKSNTYIKRLANIYGVSYQDIAKKEIQEPRWYKTKGTTINSYIVKQSITLSPEKIITVYQVSPANWVEMIEYGATKSEKQKNIAFIFEELKKFMIDEELNNKEFNNQQTAKNIAKISFKIKTVAEFCTHYPVLDAMIKKQLNTEKMTDIRTPFILQGPLMAQIFAKNVVKSNQLNANNNSKKSHKHIDSDVTTDITISGNNVSETKQLVETIFPSKREVPVVQVPVLQKP